MDRLMTPCLGPPKGSRSWRPLGPRDRLNWSGQERRKNRTGLLKKSAPIDETEAGVARRDASVAVWRRLTYSDDPNWAPKVITSRTITPSKHLELLTERPPFRLNVLVRMLRLAPSPFRRLLRRLSCRDNESLNGKLSSLLDDVSKCANRRQLESLLGPPAYAMAGEQAGMTTASGKTLHPDCIECYIIGRFCIELWFREGQVWQTVGALMPSAWDFV
jgi:hypothetical protein